MAVAFIDEGTGYELLSGSIVDTVLASANEMDIALLEVKNTELSDEKTFECDNSYGSYNLFEDLECDCLHECEQEELCECVCEHGYYYDCICECACGFEEYYIEIMPLNTFTASDWVQLQSAFSNMSTNGSYMVNIAGNINMEDGLPTIPINRTVTITGGGTLTQPTSNRHFTVAGTLILENITLSGVVGNTNNHGGITVSSGGRLYMEDGSTITGNRANISGGGVSNSGHFTIRGGVISNNTTTANLGGGISNTTVGTLVMESGIISGNIAELRGGGVANTGSFTINNGTINGNRVYRPNGGGGGVYNFTGTFIMNGGTISDNAAAEGGGLWNMGFSTMNGGEISGNTATQGGGIHNNTNHASFTMNNGLISGNDAMAGAGISNFSGGSIIMRGGEISGNTRGVGVANAISGSTFVMYNGTISNNSSAGVSNSGTFTMYGGTISENLGLGGAGGVFNSGTFTMHNGSISNNNSVSSGGGISISGGTVTLYAGTISGNRANGTNALVHGGGGIAWTNEEALLNLTIAPAVVLSNNIAATGLRINDALNNVHNINANGRINPGTWTGSDTGISHAFNNHDIRTPVVPIQPPPIEPEYRNIRIYYVIDNDNVDEIVISPMMSNYPLGYIYEVNETFYLTGSRAIDMNALPGDNVYIFEGWFVFVGEDWDEYNSYLPGLVADQLQGSFVVPQSTAGEDVWDDITLYAVWSLREAQDAVTPPSAPTPPPAGALPATGIESSVTLWVVLLSLTVLVITGVVIWLVISKKKNQKATLGK